MPPLVAALDADVLVPILSCDFLLTAFDLGLYEPAVSNQVLVEVDRNLRADFPQLDPVRLSQRVWCPMRSMERHPPIEHQRLVGHERRRVTREEHPARSLNVLNSSHSDAETVTSPQNHPA